jgi:hypothetical protein
VIYDICPAANAVTQDYGCTSLITEWVNDSCPAPHRFHSGIDFGIDWALTPNAVLFRKPAYVTRAGVVVAVGADGGDALFVKYLGDQAVCIKMDEGKFLIFAHLDQAMVMRGQRVKEGDVAGLVGTRGLSTAPHLHVEVRSDGAVQNGYVSTIKPTTYLNLGGDDMDQATFNQLVAGNAYLQDIAFRLEMLTQNEATQQGGPSKGQPNKLKAEIDALKSALTTLQSGGGLTATQKAALAKAGQGLTDAAK